MNKTSKGLNRYEIHLSDKLMSEIESIAMMEGAKVHHISKKPIIKDTVISLLELGIKAVYEGVELPKKPNDTNTDNDNRIDLSVLDNRIEEKLKPLYSLVSELTDKLNRIANTDKDSYSDIDTDTVTEYELIGIEKASSECPTLPLNEDEEDKIPEQENKPKDEQKELTDLQKEVLEKIAKIPSGDKFSLNSLSKELKISRTVLGNFDHWKKHFSIIKKSRGCDYIKI